MGVNEAGKDMVRLDNVKFEQTDSLTNESLSSSSSSSSSSSTAVTSMSDPLLLEQKPIIFRRNRPGTKAQVFIFQLETFLIKLRNM